MTNPPAYAFSLGRFLGAVAFLGLTTAAACGGGADAPDNSDICSGPDCSPLQGTNPCKDVLKDQCGKACSPSALCSAGLFCGSEGKCTAQCLAGEANQCGADNHCSADGHCQPGPDLGGGLGGADSGTGGGSGCIDVDVDFTPQTPTVMLLVDRSGSMNAPDDTFEGAPNWECNEDEADWRWNVARYVLMHPTEGVVKPLEGKVRFGQALYSGKEHEECPQLRGVVQPALNNYSEMLDNFPCSDIHNDTPTKEALEAVVGQLEAFDEPGPKIVVLATDGAPDSCEYYDWDQKNYWEELGIEDQAEADQIGADIKQSVVEEAAAAHEKDITVHTVLIANENDQNLWNHIQAVAEAGGGQAFGAYDVEALKSAFQNIVDGARNCKIDLTGTIGAGKESEGTVTLDGETLVLDGPNGWKVNTASQIELLGDSCDAIKAGDHNLAIKFPCGTFVPDIK